MIKNIITSAIVALVVAFLVVGLVGGKRAAPTNLGGVTNFDNLTLTTTNAATSTIAAGCYQTTATSTASPVILTFGTSFTGTTTFPTGLAVSGGLVAWKFGTCPQ